MLYGIFAEQAFSIFPGGDGQFAGPRIVDPKSLLPPLNN